MLCVSQTVVLAVIVCEHFRHMPVQEDVVSVVLREDTQLWGDFLLLCEVAVLVDQHGGGVCQKIYVSRQNKKEFCNAVDQILKIKNKPQKTTSIFLYIIHCSIKFWWWFLCNTAKGRKAKLSNWVKNELLEHIFLTVAIIQFQ